MTTDQLRIDLNCDMGESYGHFRVGNDEPLFPLITSCNIACGFHGGDPLHMEQTITQALAHGVRIGAHPSYPDLAGFGRRYMQIPPEELRAIVKYQIAALRGMVESLGGRLSYVKPHGALYNAAAVREAEALAVVRAVKELDPRLALLGLAGSMMENVARQEGIPFVAEAFADRRYEAGGQLMARAKAGAVIGDPAAAAAQALSIVRRRQVEGPAGEAVPVRAQSICIHGDNPAAAAILRAVRDELTSHQVRIQAFAP